MAATRPSPPNAGPPGAAPQMDGPSADEASLGELISKTTTDLSQLLRDEVELAKVELKEEAKTIGKASAKMGTAGLLGYLTLTLLCFAAAWGLSEIVPEGVAFLIVAVVVGIVAAVIYTMGKKDLENFTPVPQQTVETIQEDVQWAKQLRN